MLDAAQNRPHPRVGPGLLIACLLALGIACDAAAAPVRKTAPEPAATLLLPYFELDLDNAMRASTSFSINNASSDAVLANVTVWSDLSVPVLNFSVYLTGYDVQTFNLIDILITGMLPRTASAGQDPADIISPQGPLSQDINFASCTGLLPYPPLPPSFLLGVRKSLIGQPATTLAGRCAGRALGDNVARGYITIDTVSNCTLRTPADAGYFAAGGTGDATDQNVLWGDYFYLNQLAGTAEGNPLVHIVADPDDPETSTAGQYTFYGRYVGWSAADNRRPLGTNFAVRYLHGGVADNSTSLIVWRDSKVNQHPFTCPALPGSLPSWYELGEENVLAFDEQEQVQFVASDSFSPQESSPFPAETQRVEVGGDDLPVFYDFGWLSLNLNTTVTPAGSVPPVDPAAAQAWVAVKMSGGGTFTVGFDAIQLDNAEHAIHN